MTPKDLCSYVKRLVKHHIPDGHPIDIPETAFARALERVETCLSQVHRKYFMDEKTGFRLDHLNGDHMATLLYFLSNTIWRNDGDTELSTRLFYLNKIMHGLDLFYSVAMPEVFLLVHPLGTVLGNAKYSDYLVVYQGVTVGAVTTDYPTFEGDAILYSRSSVLGGCRIGANVVVAANAMVVGSNVPSDTLVTGCYPANRFTPNKKSVRTRCFDRLSQ